MSDRRDGDVTAGSYITLEDRGVLALEGEDVRPFLQGLISNDIEKVTDKTAIYAALLTPQGKYLFDFMIAQQGERLLLETEAARLPALSQRLTMYKLRAKVEIADVSEDMVVLALPDAESLASLGLSPTPGAAISSDDGVVFVDPRMTALGARAVFLRNRLAELLEPRRLEPGEVSDLQTRRYQMGVPEGSSDLTVDKATLLESGFEELNGVDFDKGCFVGQELTARMKYRALVKKRLMPVQFDGVPPAAGTPIKAEAREIGEIRSAIDGIGLALMRLDRLAEVSDQGKTLMAGDVAVTPSKPDWVNF